MWIKIKTYYLISINRSQNLRSFNINNRNTGIFSWIKTTPRIRIDIYHSFVLLNHKVGVCNFCPTPRPFLSLNPLTRRVVEPGNLYEYLQMELGPFIFFFFSPIFWIIAICWIARKVLPDVLRQHANKFWILAYVSNETIEISPAKTNEIRILLQIMHSQTCRINGK